MLKRFFLLYVSFLIYSLGVFSQSIFYNSPVSLGTGATGVTQTDVWSIMQNPAGTANIHEMGFAMGYYLPYFANELSSQSIMVAFPSSFGVVAGGLSHFGFQLYQENRIDLNYAKNITPNLRAAFQLNLQSNHISQSGSGYQFYSGFGLHYLPGENIVLGFYLSNPERAVLTIQNEDVVIPSVYILGLSWKASESFRISTEMEKQLEFKSLVKFGMEYNITNSVWIRIGVLGKPINYTFGLGFKLNRLKLDAALIHHQILGISTSIGLSFQIAGKK